MRGSHVLFAVVALATASAGAEPTKPAVDFRTLPAPCRTVAAVPKDAATVTPTMNANISAASCVAMVNLRALKLTPTVASADALVDAIQPALHMLDAVIQTGDVPAQILAQHAKADLYQGITVRLLSTASTIDQANQLAPMVQPWREQARASYRAVGQLATSVQDRVKTDPVLAFAVSDSQFEQSSGIATR